MKDEFSDAHFKDIGINSFIYELATHETVITEIKDILSNFECWMKK